jgi:hypothetical protein
MRHVDPANSLRHSARTLAPARPARARRVIGAVLVLAAVPWTAWPAEPGLPSAGPAQTKVPLISRFYGGVNVDSVHYDDKYADIAFAGSSIGLGLYTGFRVNDHLSVELAYDATDAIDKHNVAGSGVVYFNVDTEMRVLSASVQRQFSLRDLFNLPRDWRVYGMFGVYDSKLDRTVTDLASYAQKNIREDKSGALGGFGMVYGLRRLELRAGFRLWGDGRDLGIAAQFRF